MASLLGSLLIRLGLDLTEFRSGLTASEKELRAAQRRIERTGRDLQDFGAQMAAAVTLPLAAAGAGVIKTAGDFESAMTRIEIATQATAGEMRAMNDLALQIGKDTVFGASDAASAMEMLAKTGIDTRTILDGAAKAVVNLAAAAGSQLDPAASAIADSINQFKLSSADLPTIVNQITGAVNESKFEFADFTQGMAQGGGVAASAGMSFQDFAATLAGISSQFASGSDAGTSLKTFLLALVPTTEKAAQVMANYGLSFFDANGQMRSAAEIAEQLQTKFAGLSDEARNAAFKEMFGTDAIRTAVGLMNLGAEGIDRLKAKLGATDAEAQAAKRMEGFNGQLEQLKGALETLAIRIGQSGVLEAVTGVVTGIGNLVDKLGEASPTALKFATIILALVAAIGPLAMLVGMTVSAMAPLGAMVAGLGGGFGGLLAAAAPLLPVIAAIAAVGAVVYANWDKIRPVLADLAAKFQEVFGPQVGALVADLGSALSSLWSGPLGLMLREVLGLLGDFMVFWLEVFGNVAVRAVGVTIEVVRGFVNFVTNMVRAIHRLLTGDFAGAWEAAKAAIIGSMDALVRSLSMILTGKLDTIWKWVTDKIEVVRKAFFNLYDAVVGHSYIPDMVDGIADQMARLDGVMVDPTRKATSATAQAFKDLADEVQPILDRLFPEARALNDYRRDLATLNRAEKAGAIDPAQAEEARRRLRGLGPGEIDVTTRPVGSAEEAAARGIEAAASALGKLKRAANDNAAGIEAANVRVVESFKDVADKTIAAIDRTVRAVQGGGFLDILGAVIGLGLQLGSIGLFGKKVQANINAPQKMPQYADGTNWHRGGWALVGERGPEVVKMPRGSSVVPNHQLGNLGLGPQRLEIYDTTGLFRFRVDGQIAEATPGIAAAGAEAAGRRQAWTQGRRVA